MKANSLTLYNTTLIKFIYITNNSVIQTYKLHIYTGESAMLGG